MQLRAERDNAIDREALGYQSYISWFITILAMILFVAVFSVSMEAQVACIPPPTNRTPGLPGPPDWLGTINPPIKTGLDDPRWDGAGSLTWANGTSGDTAQFQAISSGGKLFLSWLVKLPPQSPSNANVVYVGFTQASGTPANFAMAVNLSSTTPQSDGTDYSLSAFSVDNAGVPTTLGSIPPWMNNTRVWITNSNFAVQMIVPISAAGINTGVNLGTDFKMWFEMQEALPPATPATVWDAVFPDGRGGTPVATDVTQPGFTVQYPAPSSWASFHQSTGPGDAACTLGGISITENQIGTLNVDPVSHLPAPNEILFDQVGVNTRVNTFFASPKNGMTTTIPAGGITATFRIADWGSTYDPNAPWTTIPGGQDVPSTLAINAGATASNTTINFNWTVQDIASGEPWLTEFRGGKESDQCMLVELAGGALSTWQGSHAYAVNATIVDPLGNLQRVTVAGTSGGLQPSFNGNSGGATVDNTVTWTNAGPAIGPGLTFLNNSVLTNMTFKGASEVRQKAAINIQGLAPLSPAPRDVYLFVQTVNMPSVPETVWKNVFNRLFGSPASRSGEKSGAVLRQMSAAQINETVPSYRVFVFHDSGKKVKVGSQEFLIVHPQSGFGYYVIPHADVTGWAHSLEGANEIAPDFYRIAIPNNGISHVVTVVKALEGVPPININGKFAVFADLGVAIPHGTLGNVADPGVSFNAGLEYMLKPNFSVEGILGVHHFSGKIAGDTTAIQFTGGGKFYFMPGPNRPFVRAGLGGYHFTSGTTNFGGYFGGGWLHEFNAHFGVEGVYTFHTVNTPGTAAKFSTIQGGVRYAF